MRNRLSWILVVLLLQPAFCAAKPKPRPKAPTAAQLQAQIKKLTSERDELKERVAVQEGLQQELAAAQRSRDLAKEEAETVRTEFDRLKSSLKENQSSGDTLIRELQQAKTDLASAREDNTRLRRELGLLNARVAGQVGEGALLPITPDIQPARPMNVKRVTPSVKKVDRGVVVVNVLVNEQGEVLDARLLQGLPGDGEWVQKANEACVEAAKRLVFDAARTKDGIRVRVWQGVGFLLD
jgi:multidrug efflux pump subunit AcrA (membrane-fusion protein)